MAFSVSKAVFARPMLRSGFDGLANGGGYSGAIVAMNLVLPEGDRLAGCAGGITEEGMEALRPGERAAG